MSEEKGIWNIEWGGKGITTGRSYPGFRDDIQNGLLTVQDGTRVVVFNLNHPEVRWATWSSNENDLMRPV